MGGCSVESYYNFLGHIRPPLMPGVSKAITMNERNLLFVKYDLRGTIDNIYAEISREINSFESDYLLSVIYYSIANSRAILVS